MSRCPMWTPDSRMDRGSEATMRDCAQEEMFRDRGVKPEVVEGAFHPYEQGGDVEESTVYNGVPPDGRMLARYAKRCRRLARKAPGVMMVRFPVPEAEQFIFNEQRPEWAIWVGDPGFPSWMGGIPAPHDHADLPETNKEKHLGRDRSR